MSKDHLLMWILLLLFAELQMVNILILTHAETYKQVNGLAK